MGASGVVRGSFVALITPMNRDYSVDYRGFETLLDFHRQHSTSAVLIMGSSGEVSMLTPEERHRIVAETAALKTAAMPQWYGCTGPTTEATIAYVRQAADAGADGAVLAAPPYVCTSAEDIVTYFLDVAEASPIPLGIYNNPPRVKTDLSAADILRIAAHPNVVIHKESTGRVAQVAEVLRGRPEGFAVMCCCAPDLGLIVPTMSLGGDGTANVTGNLAPRELAELSTPWDDPAQSVVFRDAYLRLLPLLQFAYAKVNPVPVKCFLDAVGMPAGPSRRPLQPLAPDVLVTGLKVARELGLDTTYGFELDRQLRSA